MHCWGQLGGEREAARDKVDESYTLFAVSEQRILGAMLYQDTWTWLGKGLPCSLLIRVTLDAGKTIR